jgi:hypothetical protein
MEIIGRVEIECVKGELKKMEGRRLREVINKKVESMRGKKIYKVIVEGM